MILNCYKDYDNHIKTYPEDDYEGMMVFNPENYEDMSAKTCIVCGEPATHMTKGWICPVCDNCG